MFVGHWAPALAIASRRKSAGIGTLFLAGQLVDWVFFALVLAGIEKMRVTPGISVMNPMDLYYMPFTHSLLGSAVLSALFASLLWGIFRDRTIALTGGVVALSHWFLDLLVHVPDLTLWGVPPKLGMGLWNHPAIEMPLELGLTFGAMWLYWHKRRPGRSKILMLALVLLVLQAINWFGPVEADVSTGSSVLAFFAYSLGTITAWWVGKSEGEAGRKG